MNGAAEQLRERHPRFPSALEAFFLVIALFVAEFVTAAALRDFNAMAGIDARDISGAVTVIGNGVLFTLLLHYKRMGYASLFHASRSSVRATLGTLTVPILATIPAAVMLMWIVSGIVQFLFPLSNSERSMFERMMSNELAAFVASCVLAPLLEEMLFRGIILRSFLLQYPRRRAYLYSAALFGLAHLNIYQFAVGFFGGLCLAWLYERTRSLWPCIVAHAGYNGLITWIWWSAATTPEAFPTSWGFWLLSLPLAAGGVLVLRRLLGPST